MIPPRPSNLLMFAWLTIGYAVVHMIAALWAFSVLQAIGGTTPSEHLQVVEGDGPVIAIQTSVGNMARVAYRRLDGTRIDGPIGQVAKGVNLYPRLAGRPSSWENRISPFIDFQSPTVNWYLIVPPDRNGTGYFSGFEQLSNRHVGYLGTQGFSSQIPATDQSFDLGTARNPFLGAVAAAQTEYFHGEPYEPRTGPQANSPIPPNAGADAMWMLSNGTLYEIRLAEHTVRKLIEHRPEIRRLTRLTLRGEKDRKLELLLRTDTGLTILDPRTLAEEAIALELQQPSSNETYYELSDGQRIFVSSLYSQDPSVPHTARIFWIDVTGRVERQVDTEYAVGGAWNPAGLEAAAFPAPVIPFVAAFVAPFTEAQHVLHAQRGDKPSSYFGHVGDFFRMFKVWLVASLLIGLATGWAARRREVDVFHNPSWLWPVLVGACGWFGWMGYICLRPLPARLPHGQWLPAQPEPNRPLGTEIFA